MTTGNPCGMNWRLLSEQPAARECALIAMRDADGAFLLPDLYAWRSDQWISEADGMVLVVRDQRSYFWLPEREVIAPLEASPAPALTDIFADAESHN